MIHLRCIECGSRNPEENGWQQCRQCGDLLEAVYDSTVWGSKLNAPAAAEWQVRWRERRKSDGKEDRSGVWRFRELLPMLDEGQAVVSLEEGNTPLYALPRCRRQSGIEGLWAKHQGMNPTGSFKDLGMTAAVTRARARGATAVACASTGNTAASMAAYAAQAGMRSLVLIPSGKIAGGKLAQSMDYGAITCQLDTDFDGCARVLRALLELEPVYVVNSINPFRIEGQKTLAAEMLEQLGWEVPDHVIVPGGNLANSSALGKGFLELQAWGLCRRAPQISVIQAEGANPLARTLRETEGKALVAVEAETRATAIRIGRPASWKKAVRVLQATGGVCREVSEAEIALAKAELGAEGIGCEPASATTWAGMKQLVKEGFIGPQQKVVLVLTGHTLKDADYVMRFHEGRLLEPAETRGWERALAAQQRRIWKLPASAEAVKQAMQATLEGLPEEA